MAGKRGYAANSINTNSFGTNQEGLVSRNTPEEKQQTIRTICASANSSEDARQLLDAVGLLDDVRKLRRTARGK